MVDISTLAHGTELIKRGFAVRRLPAVPAETEGGAEDGLAPEIITDALAKYLPPFYAPSALERMQLFAVSKMRQDMSRYRSALSFWKSQLAKLLQAIMYFFFRDIIKYFYITNF